MLALVRFGGDGTACTPMHQGVSSTLGIQVGSGGKPTGPASSHMEQTVVLHQELPVLHGTMAVDKHQCMAGWTDGCHSLSHRGNWQGFAHELLQSEPAMYQHGLCMGHPSRGDQDLVSTSAPSPANWAHVRNVSCQMCSKLLQAACMS